MNKNTQKLLLTSIALIVALGIATHVDLVGASSDESGYDVDITSTITVSGSAATMLDADRLNIELGVSTTQGTAVQALSENSDQLRRVIDTIQSAGINEDDISTARFSLYPEYNSIYDPDTGDYASELAGYRVTNTISIYTDQLDKAADILDGAVSAGANQINHVRFDISSERESEARDSLISAAVGNAKHKAMLALDTLDYDIVGIKSMTVTDAGFAPAAYNARLESADTRSAPPVLAGEQHLSVSVTITFYID